MRIDRATLIAAVVTLVVYLGLAWVLSGVDIPADTPTGRSPWMRPLRVVATMGFVVASKLHVPHLGGDFMAAVIMGLVLGAVFASVRIALR